MRLSEGQVMDWTKDVTPYVDERFKEGYVPVQQAPVTSSIGGLTVELPKGTPPANQGTFSEPGQQLSDEFVQGEMQAMSCTIPSFPGSPFVPQLQPTVQPLPYIQPPILPPLPATDYSSLVWDKVNARVEALRSLEDQTPEMKATIKALEWVLETIVKVKTTC